MAVNPSFRLFVLDQLGRALPRVRARGMFGGVGIYAGDLFFALIADEALYFKVDDSNRGEFTARGMGPFRPFGDTGEVMQYYQLPDDVLEDVDALRSWADAAVAVAARKARSKSTSSKKSKVKQSKVKRSQSKPSTAEKTAKTKRKKATARSAKKAR